MIVVRRIGPEEWQQWRTLRLAALAETPYAYRSTIEEWTGPGDTEEHWRTWLADVPLTLVAELDGRPVGLAGAIGPFRGELELVAMWVAPGARGQGVGDALVDAVVGLGAVPGGLPAGGGGAGQQSGRHRPLPASGLRRCRAPAERCSPRPDPGHGSVSGRARDGAGLWWSKARLSWVPEIRASPTRQPAGPSLQRTPAMPVHPRLRGPGAPPRSIGGCPSSVRGPAAPGAPSSRPRRGRRG